MIETTLQFVADVIGAELDVCDDGYVICIKDGKSHTDLTFDEQGNFEETLVKA